MKTPILLAALLALTSSVRCFGGDPAGGKSSAKEVVAPQAIDLIDPVFGLGGKTNDEFTEMSAFLTLPLWSTIGAGDRIGGSLLFAEPYGTWGEEGELGASLGLGFRHLFSGQSVQDALTSRRPAGLLTEGIYVGGSVFLDTVNTVNDNQLWQLGAGVEAGTRYVRVRANYYAPLGDPQGVGTVETIELRNPRVSGRNVVADSTTRTIELQETPAEGWDVELALLVPYIDQFVDLQVIGGYSSFDVGGAGRLEGWRAGVEFRPVPAIAISATWYEREEYRKGDWLLGLRFEIPLGARMKDAFKFRRRHTYERMMEPVSRQNAAVLTGHTSEVVKTKRGKVSTGNGTLIIDSTTGNVSVVASDGKTTPVYKSGNGSGVAVVGDSTPSGAAVESSGTQSAGVTYSARGTLNLGSYDTAAETITSTYNSAATSAANGGALTVVNFQTSAAATSGNSSGDRDLPVLGGSYQWDTSLFSGSGTIVIISVP